MNLMRLLLRTRTACVLTCLASGVLTAGASAATITLTPTQDTTVWNRDGHPWQDVNSGGETSLDLHQEGSLAINAISYIQFDLSSLGAATINSATLGISRISPNPIDPGIGSSRSSGDGNWANSRIDIYGLDNVSGNTAQNWDESTLTFNLTGDELTESSADSANPFVGGTVTDFSSLETIGNNDSAAGTDTATLSDASLVTWLQGRVADNGLVTFLVDTTESSLGIYSKEGAADFGDLSVAPTLTLNVVPEPSALILIGLGCVACGCRRRLR